MGAKIITTLLALLLATNSSLAKPKEKLPMPNLKKAAQENHDEMFPASISSLKETDPEFYVAFTNFAFGDVIPLAKQDKKTRTLLVLASTIGSQALNEFKIMAGAALQVGATPVEIKEVLYQAIPYVGISKGLDFIHATNDLFKERGIKLPLEAQSTTTPETRLEKGLATQRAIFGAGIDKGYETSPKDTLHIKRFLSANCFGDYYTRKTFDLKMREMITLSILIALGTDAQVKAHVQGNLNMGATREELVSLITQLVPYVGYPRSLNAFAALDELSPEKK